MKLFAIIVVLSLGNLISGCASETRPLGEMRAALVAAIDGDNDESIRLTSQLLASGEFAPEGLPIIHSLRGHLYLRNGQFDASIADFTKAITSAHLTEPEFRRIEALFVGVSLKNFVAENHGGRGLAYGLKGLYVSAISDLDQAIRLNPYFVKAYLYRAINYENLGWWVLAINDLRRVLYLNGPFSDTMSINIAARKALRRLGDYL